MRASLFFIGALCISGISAAWGCIDGAKAPPLGAGATNNQTDAQAPGTDDTSPCFGCNPPARPSDADIPANSEFESIRIEPSNTTLAVNLGQSATQTFRVIAKYRRFAEEQDITSRTSFYVPDNFLVGSFPEDGSPTFRTRLPSSPSDEAQRAGIVTVEAQVRDANDAIITAKTSLRVFFNAFAKSDSAIAGDAAAAFAGKTRASARDPRIVYPNNNVMFPPNVGGLDIHWDPGADNDLFEITLQGENSKVVYYAPCQSASRYESGKCGMTLPADLNNVVATSNSGGSVSVSVRGTKTAAPASNQFGQSSSITINFAENAVEGGLYYWAIKKEPPGSQYENTTAIMRVDFGNPNAQIETFLKPRTNGLPECVGCHVLSRDGTKMVASDNKGPLVFLNDLSKKPGDPGWLTQNGSDAGPASENRVDFASFNPDGSQFVAIYDDNDVTGSVTSFFFHDGNTGLRANRLDLPFRASHPDWSPDGSMIAMTKTAADAPPVSTAHAPLRGGIALIRNNGGVWSSVPEDIVSSDTELRKNRFTPSFTPDSSIVLYTESTCPENGIDGPDCDGNFDPSSLTWAVKPEPNATPVRLVNAGSPGLADGEQAQVGDTFPRSAPFITKHKGGTLVWATVASRRKAGYRRRGGELLLWMMAIDPVKVRNGEDGSYPAFFLPFQDFGTSNHIGQWTQKVVGGTTFPRPVPPKRPDPPVGPR